MLVQNISEKFKLDLAFLYDKDEAKSITDIVLCKIYSCEKRDLPAIMKNNLLPADETKLTEILSRLMKGEPVQYITGEVYFYGLTFLVNNSVLIPRPETEFLTDLIIKENSQSDLKVIDLCTGSGCIAIVLSRFLKNAEISAVDLSTEALNLAKINSRKFNCEINFLSLTFLIMIFFYIVENSILLSVIHLMLQKMKKMICISMC